MIKSLKGSFIKDIKILFRNWSSIFLVVIGPLALMLVLILAFSNLGFNNIIIGYTNNENIQSGDFLSKIDYIGNFVKYDNLNRCHEDLKKQKIHLCVEPKDNYFQVSFDNTRELVSLVLLNQVRTAAEYEKQNLMEKRATGFINEAKDAKVSLDEAEKFTNIILNDLNTQKNELININDNLKLVKSEIRNKITELESLRNLILISKSDIQNNFNVNVDQTINTLSNANYLLTIAYDNVLASGDNDLAQQFLESINEIEKNKNNIIANKNNFNEKSIPLITGTLSEIDNVLKQMQKAEQFLTNQQNVVQNTINTIDDRSDKVISLREEIKEKRRKISQVVSLDVDEIINPLSLTYFPLFTASERLKSKSLNSEIDLQTKQRLINFGAIQTFLPLIISLLICFIATILANIFLLDEIHSSAFLRNQIAPINWVVMFFSRFSVIVLVTTFQSLIILLIGYVIFFLDIGKNLHTIILVLILLIGTYSIFGMIIAYFVRSKTTSLLVSSFFLIFNILLGGVVYPVERMAPFMFYISKLIPFTSGISMLQQSIFYNVSLTSLLPKLINLVIILILSFIILIFARKYFLIKHAKGE